jgi:hypothetical protein
MKTILKTLCITVAALLLAGSAHAQRFHFLTVRTNDFVLENQGTNLFSANTNLLVAPLLNHFIPAGNGAIVNADVSPSAAIAASKLNLDNATIFNPTLWSAGLNFRPVTDAAGTYFSITTNMPSEAPGHYGLEINTGMPIPLGDLDVFDADSDGNQLVVRGITDGSMMLIGTNEGGHVTLVRHRAINNGGLAYSLEETLLSSAGGYAHRFVGGTNKSVAINEQNAVAGVALHHYFDLLTSGGMHRSGTDPYMSFVDRNRNSASNRVDLRMDFGGFLVQMGANNYSSMTNAFWVRPGSGNGSPLIELNADVVQVRNSLSVLGALTGDGSGLTGVLLSGQQAVDVDPTGTAIGAALAGKADRSGGNTFTGANVFNHLRHAPAHSLGTVTGGSVQLYSLTNVFSLTLNGPTNQIELPDSPVEGDSLLIRFTITESGSDPITQLAAADGSPLTVQWLGRGYLSGTLTNQASANGRSFLTLYYDGAEWFADAKDDNWEPAGGGSGNVATDAIWDVKGDFAVGTGANTAARLAVAANTNSLLQPNPLKATGLEWKSTINLESFELMSTNRGTLTLGDQNATAGNIRYATLAAPITITSNYVAEVPTNYATGTWVFVLDNANDTVLTTSAGNVTNKTLRAVSVPGISWTNLTLVAGGTTNRMVFTHGILTSVTENYTP